MFYNPRTSLLHQDHIIAHELSHLLLGHHESERASAVDSSLFPSLDPAAVRFMLGRTTYEEAEERDTERLASLLQRRIIDHRRYSDEPSGDEVQDRVTHTLLRRRETR
ncbi:secondary metabolite protein [Streptomyces sp. CA-294286]|uniref:secondary metabolite protein n=1 Tax=Streptomyces sp. CA-294286 TaxID=3240070 RepID=UPI003D90B4CB